MSKLDQLLRLNDILLHEMPEYQKEGLKFPKNQEEQTRLFRSLLNLRPPMPLTAEYLEIESHYLTQQTREKGVVTLADLTPVQDHLYLWQGDITRLGVDGIVNACNSGLLGCFHPCHGCIDNAIHSCAGAQLRDACHKLMVAQGCEEPVGLAKITDGYHLPCGFVIHTVGPIVSGELRESHCVALANCYTSALALAVSHNLKSIAFCCISTGEYQFPNQRACEIAVSTVRQFLAQSNHEIKVIFNVFKQIDLELYTAELR